MANNPGDSVRIVLFDVNNPAEVMVLDEADDIGNFKLPGGKFDTPDEEPDAAAAREQREEIISEEVDVTLTRAGELVNDDGSSRRYIYYRFADPKKLKGSDDVYSTLWVTQPPRGKNEHHMQTAIDLARSVVQSSK